MIIFKEAFLSRRMISLLKLMPSFSLLYRCPVSEGDESGTAEGFHHAIMLTLRKLHQFQSFSGHGLETTHLQASAREGEAKTSVAHFNSCFT